MSVSYQLIAQPVNTNGRPETVIRHSDGKEYGLAVIGGCNAVPTGNLLALINATLGTTVQPTSAQMVGLNKYLSLIQLGHSTTAAETTLAGLS